MPALSAADREFFDTNGYVVLHDAVPPANLQAVVDALFWFLGLDPKNPDDWYREPHSPGGMVEMYQHQALWDNRQWPRIHEAMTELWGTAKLWVSIDRAGLKVPCHPAHPEWNHPGFLHLDADTTRLPITFGLQGVLYLTDTAADQGGFRCVPGWHKRVEDWVRIQSLPPVERDREIAALPDTPIPGRAGDYIIWHRGLPHGNGLNRSSRPRLAQYISMRPAGTDEAARADRVRRWQERLPPEGNWVLGDPRQVEPRTGRTAALTPLGRRLLGADPWPI